MACAPSPLHRLVIGRLIGRSARSTDLGIHPAPSWQRPTLTRRQQRRQAEVSYHRTIVPFSDLSSIDESVFFSLFGGSVHESARFFAGVSLEGLNFDDAEELGSVLSGGANFPTTIIKQRQRCNSTSSEAMACGLSGPLSDYDAIGEGARLPHVEVSRMEWAGLHAELNGGKPMGASKQLPYFFDCAAAWSGPLFSSATQSLPSAMLATNPFASLSVSKPQVELRC